MNKDDLASYDDKTKVKVLSKAIVTITRRQQQLEEDRLRLSRMVAASQEEVIHLTEAKRGLESLVVELEQQLASGQGAVLGGAGSIAGTAAAAAAGGDKAPGAAASPNRNTPPPQSYSNVLKGISSFVNVGSSSSSSLSPQDVAKLVEENGRLQRLLDERRKKASIGGSAMGQQPATGSTATAAASNENLKKLTEEVKQLRQSLTAAQNTSTEMREAMQICTAKSTLLYASFSHLIRGKPPDRDRSRALLHQLLPVYYRRCGFLFGAVTTWISALTHLLPTRGAGMAAGAGGGSGAAGSLSQPHVMGRLQALQRSHLAVKAEVMAAIKQVGIVLKIRLSGREGDEPESTDNPAAAAAAAAPKRRSTTGSVSSSSSDESDFEENEELELEERGSGVVIPHGYSSPSSPSSSPLVRGRKAAGTPRAFGPVAPSASMGSIKKALEKLFSVLISWFSLLRLHLPTLLGATAAAMEGKVGGTRQEEEEAAVVLCWAEGWLAGLQHLVSRSSGGGDLNTGRSDEQGAFHRHHQEEVGSDHAILVGLAGSAKDPSCFTATLVMLWEYSLVPSLAASRGLSHSPSLVEPLMNFFDHWADSTHLRNVFHVLRSLLSAIATPPLRLGGRASEPSGIAASPLLLESTHEEGETVPVETVMDLLRHLRSVDAAAMHQRSMWEGAMRELSGLKEEKACQDEEMNLLKAAWAQYHSEMEEERQRLVEEVAQLKGRS